MTSVLLTVYIVGFFVQWPLIARHIAKDVGRVDAVVWGYCMSLAWPILVVGAIIYKIAFPIDKEEQS